MRPSSLPSPCLSAVGQRSTATGQRPDQRQRAGDEGRLPEHLWLEDERRKLLVDVQAKQSAHAALEADVKRLHKELEQQRAETNEQTRLLRERLEHERRQGAHLELQILKAQIGASDKSEEAQEVKHEVETKTKEILKVVQVLSDQHRSAFQQVQTLSSEILRACSSRSPVVNNDLLTSRTAGIEFAGSAGASAASARVNGGVEKEQMEQGPDRDLPWFQAMKANLEEYGDVEVFLEQQAQECMMCYQVIEASYRARPRKCNHVFHVECLLHCWSEGLCPVCGTSFAPEAA